MRISDKNLKLAYELSKDNNKIKAMKLPELYDLFKVYGVEIRVSYLDSTILKDIAIVMVNGIVNKNFVEV